MHTAAAPRDVHSLGSVRLGVTLPPGAGTGICTPGGRTVSDSLKRSRMGAPNFSGIAVWCGKSADHCSSASSAADGQTEKDGGRAEKDHNRTSRNFFLPVVPCAGGSMIGLSGTSAWIQLPVIKRRWGAAENQQVGVPNIARSVVRPHRLAGPIPAH